MIQDLNLFFLWSNINTLWYSLSIDGTYSEESVKKLEKFIQEVDKLIDSKDVAWFSIQSNAMSDMALTVESFNIELQKFIQDLTNKTFIVPSFTANMRNSSQISNIKSELVDNSHKMMNEIEKLSSTVTGQRPTLHLLKYDDIQQELPNILDDALNKIDSKNESSKNVVVLYNEGLNGYGITSGLFSNDIVKALSNKKTNKQVNVFDPQT